MELIIYDKDMTRLGLIDAFESLIWTRRRRAPGEIALKMPFRDGVNALLTPGNIVMQKGGTEAMQIDLKTLSKDQDGRDNIEIKGKTLMQWMNRRILLTQIVTEDLEPVQIARRHVQETMTEPADAARKFEHVSLSETETLGADAISYKSEEHANVLDSVGLLMDEHDFGFRAITNQDTGEHVFDFYGLTDKTADSAVPCIFSPEFENIAEQNYTYSDENFRNMAYVIGEEKQTTIGEGITGAERREMHVSTTDISNEWTDEDGNKQTLTDAQVLEKMNERAREEMAERIIEETFDGKISHHGQLRYKTDFDLGDKVTCIYRRWGLRVDAPIEEITETYQGGKRDVAVLFGEGTPTIEKRIKQIVKR